MNLIEEYLDNITKMKLSLDDCGDSMHNLQFVELYGITDENVINNISGRKSNSSSYTGFKLRLVITVTTVDTRKDINECTFSSVENHYYDGQDYKPTVTVKDGGTTLTRDVDYTLTWYSLNGDQ